MSFLDDLSGQNKLLVTVFYCQIIYSFMERFNIQFLLQIQPQYPYSEQVVEFNTAAGMIESADIEFT